ncbi:hypothetical protein [Paenibacillus radicis (ex Xue et al. 2023)]|uniref:Fibronectin type-III domain-containing protein n=1 Tax=Paenibacillus radicis (ex Xue et al. 2023) TaxID=2972489 RepID=A0ABT1YCD8_9BACL|nr:hypothetical protein [Paenibacillus radicis (ex Xue et al. 2023)]MCR8630865.1 hypothetical protein [Paenibacillus radicis (ex Xue et al. 2023)]
MYSYIKKLTFLILSIFIIGLSLSSISFADEPALQDLANDPTKASASSQHKDRAASRAFDNLNTHYFVDAWEAEGKTGWLKYDFGKGNEKVVKQYSITASNFPTSSPKSWSFEGSNDNQNWIVLNSLSNQSMFEMFEKRIYAISNEDMYQFYRINVTENHSDGWMIIGEVELLGDVESQIPPIELIATPSDSRVSLNWSGFKNASSYNIERSTSVSGPYTIIATNIAGLTYVDTAVTNGTTYYYVVTAQNTAGESSKSNEASATPQGTVTPPSSNKALLVITLVSGLEKEYDLPMSEVNNFITWYNGRAAGTGSEVFTINKSFNKANFLTRKDYIAFDKVETFEVNEYTSTP